MSPPKVNLAGKEPLKPDAEVAADEVPKEKGDGLEFPSVITIETERRARNLRRQYNQQKCRRIICGIAMVIIVAVAALGTMCLVRRYRHHHRRHWNCNVKGQEQIDNVRVDHDNKLITASHERGENNVAMEILHEYGRGMVAYKDKDNNICYIDRLDETFEEGYERWESYEKRGRDANTPLKVISEKPIEIEVLRHIGDIHITAHCKGANSFWVMEIEEREVTTEMKVVYV